MTQVYPIVSARIYCRPVIDNHAQHFEDIDEDIFSSLVSECCLCVFQVGAPTTHDCNRGVEGDFSIGEDAAYIFQFRSKQRLNPVFRGVAVNLLRALAEGKIDLSHRRRQNGSYIASSF